MGLTESAYRELADIVGAENISNRQHILAAYRHTNPQNGKKQHSPAAVIMPENVQQVQEIVRACNHPR